MTQLYPANQTTALLKPLPISKSQVVQIRNAVSTAYGIGVWDCGNGRAGARASANAYIGLVGHRSAFQNGDWQTEMRERLSSADQNTQDPRRLLNIGTRDTSNLHSAPLENNGH